MSSEQSKDVRKSSSSSSSSSNISTADVSTELLAEKLKTHFNHSDFKSKLQRDAIRTILKRKSCIP